jgi:hypothetical protein
MTKEQHEKILVALRNARAMIAWLSENGPTSLGGGVAANALQLAEIDEAIDGMTRPNPDAQGFYWWLIAVGVAPVLVADGVDLTDQRAHDMLTNQFSHADGSELKAIVLGRPPDEAVAKEQGFKSVGAYRADRDR